MSGTNQDDDRPNGTEPQPQGQQPYVVRGTIVFDVPKSMKPARIELHDSLFSGGVDVAL